MGKFSAAYRVPTEIWHEIFSYVLHTWLLPGDGANIFDDLRLFEIGCKSYAEYRRMELIMQQLRAVCRHWRVIANYFVINSVATAKLEDITTTLKQRLNLSQRIEFSTECSCDKCPSRGDNADSKQPFDDSRSSLNLGRVQVICWSILDDQFIDTKHINSATNLRAISMNAANLNRIKIPDSITHLSLWSVHGSIPHTLRLPNLQFLNLDLFWDDQERSWVSWRFPKLISLHISGRIRMATHQEDLQRFISNHSSNLENLILTYLLPFSEHKAASIISVHDLQQYHRLKVLGLNRVGLGGLGNANSVDITDSLRPPLSLLLYDTFNLPKLSDASKTVKRCLDLCTPPTAVFYRVVTPYAWKEAIHNWGSQIERSKLLISSSTYNLSKLCRKLFKALYNTGIIIVDRDGVELREGDGQKFLERLGLTD